MTSQDVISVVQSLGFPVAMCAALFWFMVKQNSLILNLKDTIAANTAAIVKLSEHLDS